MGRFISEWRAHTNAPERTWNSLCAIEVQDIGEAAALASLLVHVGAAHLGSFDDARERIQALANRWDSRGETRDGRQLWRLLAAIHSCQVSNDAFSRALSKAVTPEDRTEEVLATVLATVATIRVVQGSMSGAAQSLDRVVRLTATAPAPHLARALAIELDLLADHLCDEPRRAPIADGIMLRVVSMARNYWSIAGTWQDLSQSEERMARCHLAAGQPESGLLHANAALAMVDAHDGGEVHRMPAWVVSLRCLHALGQRDQAAKLKARLEDTIQDLSETDRGCWVETLATLT